MQAETKNRDVMIDEEYIPDMCNEPVAALPQDHQSVPPTFRDDIDEFDWEHYPIFGPKTVEEAVSRVDQAWEDRNDPSKWASSEQMWNRLFKIGGRFH